VFLIIISYRGDCRRVLPETSHFGTEREIFGIQTYHCLSGSRFKIPNFDKTYVTEMLDQAPR